MGKKRFSEKHIKFFAIIIFVFACIALTATIYFTFKLIKVTTHKGRHSQILNESTFDGFDETKDIIISVNRNGPGIPNR